MQFIISICQGIPLTPKALRLTLLLACSVMMTNCAMPDPNSKPITPAEEAALGGIEVCKAVLDPQSWQGVDATDTAVSDSIYTNAAVLSGGDNVIMAIGSSISRGIARGQQNDFVERNASAIPVLQSAATDPRLLQELDKAVLNALERTTLKSKLKPPFESKVWVHIAKCGFRRQGLNAQQEVLLAPYIEARLSWMRPSPPMVYLRLFTERSAGTDHYHTAQEFATQPALRDAAFKAIVDSMGQILTATLEAKIKR